MLNDENKELCWKVLAKYGIIHQMDMVIEECAELQKAVCKMFRSKTAEHYANFIEELIDVIVMCQQMLLNSGMDMDEVNKRARVKLERALHETDKA